MAGGGKGERRRSGRFRVFSSSGEGAMAQSDGAQPATAIATVTMRGGLR
jgi:hypothetical protein